MGAVFGGPAGSRLRFDFLLRWPGRRPLPQRSDPATAQAAAAGAPLQIRWTPTWKQAATKKTHWRWFCGYECDPRQRDEVSPSDAGEGESWEAARQRDGDGYGVLSHRRAGGHTGCVHVFIAADRGQGRLTDTNCGFNLLLRFKLTPLHLAAATSTRDILTISLKSLVPPCLNFLFFFLCRLTSHSPMKQLDILATSIFCLRSQCLTASSRSFFLISLHTARALEAPSGGEN